MMDSLIVMNTDSAIYSHINCLSFSFMLPNILIQYLHCCFTGRLGPHCVFTPEL